MLPSISFVLPTFNSQKYIKNCLDSIYYQTSLSDFDFEILIIDGGSTDETLKIVNKYKDVKLLNNSLKTGEAGKYVGIKKARHEYICLIDSDNVLDKDYIINSLKHLSKNYDVSGVEPIRFGYNKDMGLIDKYCALAGINDPLNLYFGNFDKESVFFKNNWTNKKYKIIYEDDDILKFQINHQDIPTIGANGSIFKRLQLLEFLNQQNSDFFFDVDFLMYVRNRNGYFNFTKIKLPIYHYYCGSNFFTFFKKQQRRINDFFKFEELRLHNPKKNLKSIITFIIETIFLINFIKSIFICIKNKNLSLIIHSPLSFLTLFIYSKNMLLRFFR